ncbi:MAG: rhomboid family intramembrane serine protease [Anaerolineaceae bacterium]|nr:rhomboid family intramembrane serine protease [Anaerolineaceae bacterium]
MTHLNMKTRTPLSNILIALSIFFFILQNISKSVFGYDLLLLYGAKINQYILQGQIWRFLTPAFLHGSILHLGFNMYALYIIGPTLERKYGNISFVLLYFIGAIIGNVFSFLFSSNISLGSSTAIFGLIAAQGVYIYKNRHLLGPAAKPLLTNVIFVIAINLFLGLSPGIDNWGHLGGLTGGFLYAWFAGPSFGISENVFGRNVIFRENKKIFSVTALILILAIALVGLGYILN